MSGTRRRNSVRTACLTSSETDKITPLSNNRFLQFFSVSAGEFKEGGGFLIKNNTDFDFNPLEVMAN
jgi:hypothetical protein